MQHRKKISLSLAALTLIGLSIWAYTRWDVWFGNPPEPLYTTAAQPHRLLLSFGNNGPLSRTVSWTAGNTAEGAYLELHDLDTNEEAVCVPAESEVFASRSGVGAFHHAHLDRLLPGHHYRYRAVTHGKATAWHHFRMPLSDLSTEGDFAFLYFGDIQDSIGGKCGLYVRNAMAAHPEAEFTVLGGDLIERPTDAYWEEAFRSLGTMATTLPILAVAGNHEYLKQPIRQLERRFSLTFPYFLDAKVSDNHVFTLNYHAAQFYLLDSNRELPFLLTQRDWLSKAFKESAARWQIVVLHHPIYSLKGSTNNLVQRTLFADLLNENADLVLQGHEHAYGRMTQRDDSGKATPPLYTVSHCSPKHYRIEFDERFDRFGTGAAHYQLIRIHGDTLSMRTYDATTQQLYDAVDIVKGEHDRPTIYDLARNIPEILRFTPRPNNKKDAAFARRIADYKKRKQLRP